jgi:hypothetical protein
MFFFSYLASFEIVASHSKPCDAMLEITIDNKAVFIFGRVLSQ